MYVLFKNATNCLVIDSKKKYTIYGASVLLDEEEEAQREKRKLITVDLEIYQGKKRLYTDEISLGDNKGFALMSHIEEKMILHFGENDQVRKFLDNLYDAYTDNQNTEYKDKTKRKTPRFPIQINYKKMIKFAIASVLVVIGCGVVFFGSKMFLSRHSEPELTESKVIESFENLMANEKYVEAGEAYPKRVEEIEQTLFIAGDLNQLKEFVKSTDTLYGSLDVAFLEKDWSKVINLNKDDLNIDKKAMVAFAYIKSGDIDSAKELNEEVKSDKLSKLISDYTLLKSAIQTTEEKLKSKDVSDKEKKELSENLEAMKTQLELLGE